VATLTVGELIRLHRIARRLSQEALAQRAGLSRVGLASVETGAKDPKFRTVQAIAHGLGLTVNELLKAPEVTLEEQAGGAA
jgi:transcriptional regulator with XRE-family HTH domain